MARSGTQQNLAIESSTNEGARPAPSSTPWLSSAEHATNARRACVSKHSARHGTTRLKIATVWLAARLQSARTVTVCTPTRRGQQENETTFNRTVKRWCAPSVQRKDTHPRTARHTPAAAETAARREAEVTLMQTLSHAGGKTVARGAHCVGLAQRCSPSQPGSSTPWLSSPGHATNARRACVSKHSALHGTTGPKIAAVWRAARLQNAHTVIVCSPTRRGQQENETTFNRTLKRWCAPSVQRKDTHPRTARRTPAAAETAARREAEVTLTQIPSHAGEKMVARGVHCVEHAQRCSRNQPGKHRDDRCIHGGSVSYPSTPLHPVPVRPPLPSRHVRHVGASSRQRRSHADASYKDKRRRKHKDTHPRTARRTPAAAETAARREAEVTLTQIPSHAGEKMVARGVHCVEHAQRCSRNQPGKHRDDRCIHGGSVSYPSTPLHPVPVRPPLPSRHVRHVGASSRQRRSHADAKAHRQNLWRCRLPHTIPKP